MASNFDLGINLFLVVHSKDKIYICSIYFFNQLKFQLNIKPCQCILLKESHRFTNHSSKSDENSIFGHILIF